MSDSNKAEEVSASEPSVSPTVEAPIEQLGSLLVVASPKLWIALAWIVFLLIGIITWSFLGSIPIQVLGTGVFMTPSGVFSIEAKVQGHVKDILIQPGQHFAKGTSLVHLHDPQLEAQLLGARQRLEALKEEQKDLKEEVGQEAKAERNATLREIAATEFRIESLKKQLPKLQDSVRRRHELYEGGLISIEAVRQAENILMEREVSLEAAEANLVALHSRLTKSYRNNEISLLERDVLRAEHEVELLLKRREQLMVEAPHPGKLLELLVEADELVAPGEAVAWAEGRGVEDEELLVFAFVAVEMGKRITVGNSALIEVTNVNAQEFGMIKGEVIEVSPYAISPEGITKAIHNQSLGHYLMGGLPAVVQVIVRPLPDSDTPSGYAWTSEVGPPFSLSTGTVCKVKAIVEEVTPIHYVFPMWRLKKLMSQ